MSTNHEISQHDPVECEIIPESRREDEDPIPINTKGEVTEKTGDTIKIESYKRTIEANLNTETAKITDGTYITQTADSPITELRKLTIEDALLDTDLPDYAERYTEGEDGIQNTNEVVERANKAIKQIVSEFSPSWLCNNTWIGHGDAFKAYEVYKNGVEQRIDEYNEWNESKATTHSITFPNKESALLWVLEISGQISDGAWENEARDWEKYCYAEIKIDTELEKPVLEGHLKPLEYKEKLLEFDGLAGRMMFYVIASGVNPDFNRGDLAETLEQIEAMHE
jgi:hypothetical protein